MAGIDLDAVEKKRFGVLIGSGVGGLEAVEDSCRHLACPPPAPPRAPLRLQSAAAPTLRRLPASHVPRAGKYTPYGDTGDPLDIIGDVGDEEGKVGPDSAD